MEKKTKFNWFDCVVIALIVCAIFMLYQIFKRDEVDATNMVQYTFELLDNEEGFVDRIQIGDVLTDNIDNKFMGTVVAVEKTDYAIITYDKTEGNYAANEVPIDNRETAIVTVEAPVYDDGINIKVTSGFTIRSGLSVAPRGEDYAGRGYILYVDRDSLEEDQ